MINAVHSPATRPVARTPRVAAKATAKPAGDQLLCTRNPDGTMTCVPATIQEGGMRRWQKVGLSVTTFGGAGLGALFGLFAAGMATAPSAAQAIAMALQVGGVGLVLGFTVGAVGFWLLPSLWRAIAR